MYVSSANNVILPVVVLDLVTTTRATVPNMYTNISRRNNSAYDAEIADTRKVNV